jgi:hypothetical protein
MKKVAEVNGKEVFEIRGKDLTEEQKGMLTFHGMSNPEFVKNHGFYFVDGKPSKIDGYYYPMFYSLSHVF